MAIFTHVTVGTNDLAKARSFYDRVLGTLGYKRLNDLGDNGSIWGESAPEFFVLKPANGQPASFANGGTISFVAPSRAAVAEFHKAALAAGGKDEGPAGRAAGIPVPMRAMSAISTATSWPLLLQSRVIDLVRLAREHRASCITTVDPSFGCPLTVC